MSQSQALSVCALASACAETNQWQGLGETCSQLVGIAATSRVQGAPDTSTLTFQGVIACLSGKTTCGEYKACIDASESLVKACEGRDGKDVCVGNTLVECTTDATRKPAAVDCAKVGLVCGQTDSGASCGHSSCDPKAYVSSCDGSRTVTCSSSGVVQKRDCQTSATTSCTASPDGTSSVCASSMGGTCAMVDGGAICQGTGDACDSATAKGTCEGTSLVGCRAGKKSSFDCASLGGVCVSGIAPDNVAKCMFGDECKESEPETCADGKASYCLGGKKATLDCKAMGFSGCATSTRGDRTVAKCTP